MHSHQSAQPAATNSSTEANNPTAEHSASSSTVNRAFGAVGLAGGAIETTLGATCIASTDGIGAVLGCAAVTLHGIDVMKASADQLVTGEPQKTKTQQVLAPVTGEALATTIDIGISIAGTGLFAAPRVPTTLNPFKSSAIKIDSPIQASQSIAKPSTQSAEILEISRTPIWGKKSMGEFVDFVEEQISKAHIEKRTISKNNLLRSAEEKFGRINIYDSNNNLSPQVASILREKGLLAAGFIPNSSINNNHADHINSPNNHFGDEKEKQKKSGTTTEYPKITKRKVSQNKDTFEKNQACLLNDIATLSQDVRDILQHQKTEQANKKIAETINGIGHGFNLAANIAMLSNQRVAHQISVVGSAVTQTASIIAGLNGVGLLAGISPLAAGAGFLCAITSVASLFGDEKNQSQSFLREAIIAQSEMMRAFREEMRDYFNLMLDTMSESDKKSMLHFLEIKNDTYLLNEKMNLLHDKLSRARRENQAAHETSLAQIKKIVRSQTGQLPKRKYDEIISKLEEAENYVIRSKEDLQTFNLMMNQSYTLLQGSTGCKSSDVTGTEITLDLQKKDPTAIMDLLETYYSPFRPIRTLSHYQSALKLPSDYFYTPEAMDTLLENILTTPENSAVMTTTIQKTHRLSHLLFIPKNNPTLADLSLSGTMAKFFGSAANNDSSSKRERTFIPLWLHGHFNLLVLEKNPRRFFYFGTVQYFNRVKEVLDLFLQVSEVESEIFNENTDFYNLESIPANLSALWLLNFIKTMLSIDQLDEKINVQDAHIELFPSPAQYQEQHLHWQASLKRVNNPINPSNPVSPVLWNVAVKRYLQLFSTKLINPENETSYLNATYDDIKQLQNLLDDAESTRQLLLRTRNNELFHYLIQNYAEAVNQLSIEATVHLESYETRISNEYNILMQEKLGKTRADLNHKLSSQSIDFRGDYPCQRSYDWYTAKTPVTFHIRNWFSGFAVGRFVRASSENVGHVNFNNKLKQEYLNGQRRAERQLVKQHIDTQAAINHQIYIKLFSPSIIQKKNIPTIVQHDSLIMLPAVPTFANFMPNDDQYYEAQGLALGEIVYKSEIKNSNFFFIRNSHFMMRMSNLYLHHQD